LFYRRARQFLVTFDAVFKLFAGPTGLLFHASLQLRKLIGANECDRLIRLRWLTLDRRHLLPDKCRFKTEIDAYWRFQLVLFPSREGKPVELGNLRSIR
jgi:hypothetical protein